MKIFKSVLIVIVILIAIPLIIALFTANDYKVERSVTINKPKQQVFDYIKLLRNQPNYSVWAKIDPNAKMTYTGADGTPGFVAAWDGNKKMGKGEQQITGVADGERMDIALHFIKPMEGRANAYMTTQAASADQTMVTWGMTGRMAYPMNFMLVIMNMDNMLGKELQGGLDNLKAIMEKP